jgi:hypothetical protein
MSGMTPGKFLKHELSTTSMENGMKSIIALALLASGVASAQSYDTNYGTNSFAHLSNGSYDSAFGYNTMFYETSGYYNSGFGYQALLFNSTGDYNTAFGAYAAVNTIADENTAIGMEALYGNQTGSNNIAIGYYAGGVPAAGNNNIEIGNYGLGKDNNVIRIGTQGVQTFTQIAGIYGRVVKGGQNVVITSKGQLGVSSTAAVSVATQADILSLRQEIAALKNQVYALQARK